MCKTVGAGRNKSILRSARTHAPQRRPGPARARTPAAAPPSRPPANVARDRKRRRPQCVSPPGAQRRTCALRPPRATSFLCVVSATELVAAAAANQQIDCRAGAQQSYVRGRGAPISCALSAPAPLSRAHTHPIRRRLHTALAPLVRPLVRHIRRPSSRPGHIELGSRAPLRPPELGISKTQLASGAGHQAPGRPSLSRSREWPARRARAAAAQAAPPGEAPVGRRRRAARWPPGAWAGGPAGAPPVCVRVSTLCVSSARNVCLAVRNVARCCGAPE